MTEKKNLIKEIDRYDRWMFLIVFIVGLIITIIGAFWDSKLDIVFGTIVMFASFIILLAALVQKIFQKLEKIERNLGGEL